MARTHKTKTEETKMPSAIQTLYYHAKNSPQESKLMNLVNQLVELKPSFDGKSLVLDLLLRIVPTEIAEVTRLQNEQKALKTA